MQSTKSKSQSLQRKPQKNAEAQLILLRKTLQENVRNVTKIFSNVFVLELLNVLIHSNVFLHNKELQRL